jgi:hypothetical protein
VSASIELPKNSVLPMPRWAATGLWIAVIVGIAVALARIAVWLQVAHFAALGVFPAILGATCGIAVAWIGRQLAIRGRRKIIVAAVFAAVVIVAVEHMLFYLDYRSQFAAALQANPKAQLAASLVANEFQPASFYRFMAAEAPDKWPLWTADALAMIAIAAFSAWLMSRWPSIENSQTSAGGA